MVVLEWYLLYNMAMDALLLLLCARLSSQPVKMGRVLMAAVFGGVYAALQASVGGMWGFVPAQLLMVFLAFGRMNIRSFAKLAGQTLLGALLLGGLGYALLGGLGPRFGMTIAISLAIGGIALSFLWHDARRRAKRENFCCVLEVHIGEKRYRLDAYLDTGNHLMEPISGLPVILAHVGSLPKIEELMNFEEAHCRYVALRTVAGQSVLPCILPDELTIIDNDGSRRRAHAYIAVGGAQKMDKALLPLGV